MDFDFKDTVDVTHLVLMASILLYHEHIGHAYCIHQVNLVHNYHTLLTNKQHTENKKDSN